MSDGLITLFVFEVGFINGYRFKGYILVARLTAGGDFGDFINDIHARDDFAKDAVSPAIVCFSFMIKEFIINQVNKKLRTC